MTISGYAAIAVAGFAAGLLNAIAGGGTIFTFSALIAVGVPPVAANATSATAVFLGSVASTVAYRREILRSLRTLLPLCVVSIVGGGLGAILLLKSGDQLFGLFVPWLLLFATLLFAGSPYLHRWMMTRRAQKQGGSGSTGRLALPIQGLVSVYGGYFGAGMGVMMLAALSITESGDYQEANATKNLLSIVLQLAAVGVFISSGIIDGWICMIVAVPCVFGGWLGVSAARSLPERFVRRFIICSGLAISLWYFIGQGF